MNHVLPSNTYQVDGIDCVVTWMWKSNKNPFDSKQLKEWTAYPPDISAKIEQAYSCHASQIRINQNYVIDIDKMFQINVDDSHRQRSVKRFLLSNLDNDSIDWRLERFAFQLDPSVKDGVNTNTSEDDVRYHGSKFIAAWLLKFTNGRLKVKFDIIFPALVHGILIEAQLKGAPEHVTKWLIDKLEEVRDDVKKKTEFERMKYLAKRCVKLYTKDCFLFLLVNATLRDDDRTKLYTLGPYCYLVYNHIGRRTYDCFSVRYRLRQPFRPTQGSSVFVYRGDFITDERLDEYQDAAGQPHKYFRWLPFVSTSHKRDVGEFFARNVLYEIELRRVVSNDQFVDLCNNTFKPDEEEVLLRPGIRFRIEKLTFNFTTNLHEVHIKIAPSYVWQLR